MMVDFIHPTDRTHPSLDYTRYGTSTDLNRVLPPKEIKKFPEILIQGSTDLQLLFGDGMHKRESVCMQQEPVDIKLLPKELIVFPSSMLRISYDGVKDMLHMASQLMFASCSGLQSHQRVPGNGITAYRIGQLYGCHTLIMGPCLLGLFGNPLRFLGLGIKHLFQRVIDHALLFTVATHYGDILLDDLSVAEHR